MAHVSEAPTSSASISATERFSPSGVSQLVGGLATGAHGVRAGGARHQMAFVLWPMAIRTFAVEVRTSGFDLNTVGVILMVGGLLGLVVSALFWSSLSPGAGAGPLPVGTG